jgi:hypothetical protein
VFRVAEISGGPFFQAARSLTTARPDFRRLLSPATDPAGALADLRPYAGLPDDDTPRVLVVGDSTARTLGYGLERWASDTGAAVVWSAGTEGCGIVADGVVRDSSGRDQPVPASCRDVAEDWRTQLAEFDPDLVVVSSLVFDLQARRLDSWPGFLAPGDRRFDDYLTDVYVDAVDVLSSRGATVLWMLNPCARPLLGAVGDPDALATERIRYVNEHILGRVRDARRDTRLFDLFTVLCPEGEFVQPVGAVDTIRPDGVHFGAEGSVWFAERYGAELLEIGLP